MPTSMMRLVRHPTMITACSTNVVDLTANVMVLDTAMQAGVEVLLLGKTLVILLIILTMGIMILISHMTQKTMTYMMTILWMT